jgi:hypothetical protein
VQNCPLHPFVESASQPLSVVEERSEEEIFDTEKPKQKGSSDDSEDFEDLDISRCSAPGCYRAAIMNTTHLPGKQHVQLRLQKGAAKAV